MRVESSGVGISRCRILDVRIMSLVLDVSMSLEGHIYNKCDLS